MIQNHPALDRLEDRLQANVSLRVRHVRHLTFYTVSAEGFDRVGESTTVHMAVEAFLKNNGLGDYAVASDYDCNNHRD